MDELYALLHEALATEYGLILETDDPERLRQKLYRIRDDLPLSFVISPTNPQGELWLVKDERKEAKGDS